MNTNYTDYFGQIEVTALYIEDDDSIRNTFKKFLGRCFDKLFEASNGEEGLEIFEQKKIDVIITDIRMPKKDGLKLISDIKKSGRNPEFIITSAFSYKDYLIKSIDLGVTKYILKPFKIEEMKKIINETIELVKLKKKESSYQKMIEVLFNTQNGIIFLTNGLYLLNINQKGLDAIGYSSIEDFKEFYNCICEKFVAPLEVTIQDKFVIKDNFMESLEISSKKNISFKVYMFDESEQDLKIYSLKSKKHNNDLYVVNLFDITDLEYINRELEVKNLQLSSYYNIIDEHLIASETDLDGNITSVSQAFCNKTGFSKEELIGENHRIMKHPNIPSEYYKELWNTITSGRTWISETNNLTKDKKDLWVYTIIKPKKTKMEQ